MPFKLITTLSCPACGIQRFLHALTNGDVLKACHYNYYLIYALPYTLIIIATYYLPNGKLKEKMTSILKVKLLYGYTSILLRMVCTKKYSQHLMSSL